MAKRYFTKYWDHHNDQLSGIIGLGWLTEQMGGSRGAIFLPTLGQLDTAIMNTMFTKNQLKEFKKEKELNTTNGKISLITDKIRFYSKNIPVLAIFPDEKELDKITSIAGTEPLLVIGWIEEHVKEWIEIHKATELLTKTAHGSSTLTDPVVYEAMVTLTSRVNVSTGIIHPSDKSAAIDLFKILIRNGYEFTGSEIKGILINQGWESSKAQDVKELSEKLLSGKRLRGPKKTVWASDILTQLKDRADRRN